jgi:hypothetical protein
MLRTNTTLLLLALGVLPSAARSVVPARGSEPETASVTRGTIHFDEGLWGRGSLPSLTFTVVTGRGRPEKVTAFLYYSEVPQAFQTSPFPPQFVGVLTVPSSVQVIADHPPERGPINAYSREKFVQGAIFDVTTGALVDVTEEIYMDIAYDAPATTYALDFETDDDFTTILKNGQDISTPPEFGRLISVSTQASVISGHPHHGAAIFDSDALGPNQASSDPDLLVGLGNVLILQENAGQTVPGRFDLPDDSQWGGGFVIDFTGFDFIEKVEPRALDLIDVDSLGTGVSVVLTDVLGHKRSFTVPNGWTEDHATQGGTGYRTLDLTSLAPQAGFQGNATATGHADFLPGEVVRLEVVLTGSGAIDNLVFARESDPAAVTAGRGVSKPGRAPTPLR